MNDDIAIRVEHVSKTFKLPHEKDTSIKSAVVNFYKRKKTFETQQVLSDISFEIKKGEFFGIVGRNGSGKSTLLKIIAGIYAMDEGGVDVKGSLTPFIELGVGFSPELTGRENVYLNGALLGFSRKEMEALYAEIVAFAELEQFMDQKLKNYSSGMQVRLAFSIAIRVKSDILILDEVLAVGDEAFQKKCSDYFMHLKRQSQTVVLVTHDMTSVEKFCDRVLVLDKSKAIGVFDTFEAQKIYTQLNRVTIKDSQSKKFEIQSRWGTKTAEIHSVKINGKSQGTPIVVQGQKLEFVVKLKNNNTKPFPVVVGLGVHDETDTYISGPNSAGFKVNSGDELHYVVETNPLNPGIYRVEVALFSESLDEECDHVINAISFEVEGQKGTIKYGKIDFLGEWKSNYETQ